MAGFFRSGTVGNKQLVGDLYLTGSLNVVNRTHALKLTTLSGTVVTAADGAIPSPTRKKLRVLIDGVVYYLLAATDWVDANSSSASPSKSPSASLSPSASSSASASPSHI